MPRSQSRIITAFTEDEINKLLTACEYTTPAATTGRQAFKMHRPTAHRDRAILLVLLDAGLRASELCRLSNQDVDLQTGEIEVRPYLSGRKSRPRHVYPVQ